MDSLEIGGEKYIKVKLAAEMTGYTADYIGQLSRGGKIKAQLVGRSWYVREDDIRNHRRNTVRGNTQRTIEQVARERTEAVPPVESKYIPSQKHTHIFDTPITYVSDAHTLIPDIAKESTDDVAEVHESTHEEIASAIAEATPATTPEVVEEEIEKPIVPQIKIRKEETPIRASKKNFFYEDDPEDEETAAEASEIGETSHTPASVVVRKSLFVPVLVGGVAVVTLLAGLISMQGVLTYERTGTDVGGRAYFKNGYEVANFFTAVKAALEKIR